MAEKYSANDDNKPIVIDIRNSSTSSTNKYFCSYRHTRLTPYTQEDKKGGYVCTKCIVDYWPEQDPVKRKSVFDTPGGQTDSAGNIVGDNTIHIAVIDDVNKGLSETTYKQQKLSPSFEALKKQGFKFTSYTEQ